MYNIVKVGKPKLKENKNTPETFVVRQLAKFQVRSEIRNRKLNSEAERQQSDSTQMYF